MACSSLGYDFGVLNLTDNVASRLCEGKRLHIRQTIHAEGKQRSRAKAIVIAIHIPESPPRGR